MPRDPLERLFRREGILSLSFPLDPFRGFTPGHTLLVVIRMITEVAVQSRG